jgi:hypothetical protein
MTNPKDTSMCYGRNESTEGLKRGVWFKSVEHIHTEFSGVVNISRHLATEQGLKALSSNHLLKLGKR